MKVLLIDDHTLFRDALSLLLSHRLPDLTVLHAGDIAAAGTVLAAHPDLRLALLDLGLPDSEGLGSLHRWREQAPGVTTVVLSADERRDTVLAALDAGAAGFIPKTAQGTVLEDALRAVLEGRAWVPQAALDAHAAPPARTAAAATTELSPRQRDVLRLLIEGRSNKLICRELDLSESTVKTHLAAIFRRLEVENRTQAVIAAARLGLQLKG
jgi:DNA-binding NarL/FixJ family response regulator